ncbi:MAG: IS1595 family transposase [Candidatus Omnitrophota bacterium]|jgi:transposase-like protein
MKSARYTIKEFNEQFPNDDICLDFVFHARYNDKVFCETCQKITNHYRRTGRKSYACEFCGNEIFPTAGTIFHKSPTPLRSWFYAMFLMSSTRCGISAKQLERELGVTYKTAWRMFKQIRSLMDEKSGPMNGHIEVDETYIGGKHSGPPGRGADGKTPVVGLIHREAGQVNATVTKDVKARTIMPIIWNNVPRTTENTIHTDEFATYNYVQKLGYSHGVVNHGKGEYAVGINHVNTVEGFWSLVKRGINGVYHAVSPKYLQSYLNEYQYRYNHRKSATPMFSLMMNQVQAKAVRL